LRKKLNALTKLIIISHVATRQEREQRYPYKGCNVGSADSNIS